jgi:serine acetyltransferase
MLEHGTCMTGALIQDARAVCQRDPATNTLLEVVLFNKGCVALVCHRVACRYVRKNHLNNMLKLTETNILT